MSDVHSILSPSDANRWLYCGKAIQLDLERQIPDTSGADADLGSAAHAVLERCLPSFSSPHALIGEHVKIGKQLIEVDLEMANAVEIAVDYCRDLFKQLKQSKAKHFPEIRVLIPFLAHPTDTEEAGGTMDWHAYDDETLHVLDYKNGMTLVEVDDNEQLMLYVWGVLLKLNRKFKRIFIHIVQPRASHPEGPCRMKEVTMKQLLAFKAKVEAQVKAIKSKDAAFGPTEKGCHWCDHRGNCAGLAEKAITVAKQDFQAFIKGEGPGEACDTAGLSSKQLAEAMKWLKVLNLFTTSVQAEVFRRTEAGDKVMLQYYKLVTGQSNRQWKDEEAVRKAFLAAGVEPDKFAPRKLVGLGDGEALIKKDAREAFMKANTIKPQGKPALAPINDPRPAITKAADDFKEHIK